MNDFKRLLERARLAVHALIGLLGVTLIFMAFLLSSNEVLHTSLLSIGITFLASVAISAVNDYFGTGENARLNQLDNKIEWRLGELGKILNVQTLYAKGLRAAYLEMREALEDHGVFSRRVREARSIDFLHTGGRHTIQLLRGEITHALLNGCQVRALVANPDNPIWGISEINAIMAPDAPDALSDVKTPESSKQEPVKGVIRDTIAQFDGIISDLRSSYQEKCGNIEIRSYEGFTPSNIVIIDNSYVRHTPRLYGTRTEQSPVFDIEGYPGDDTLMKCYGHTFDELWKKSNTIRSFNLIAGA